MFETISVVHTLFNVFTCTFVCYNSWLYIQILSKISVFIFPLYIKYRVYISPLAFQYPVTVGKPRGPSKFQEIHPFEQNTPAFYVFRYSPFFYILLFHNQLLFFPSIQCMVLFIPELYFLMSYTFVYPSSKYNLTFLLSSLFDFPIKSFWEQLEPP